ncbi:MAG TPA: AAA family ATPase [Micropepsaceae bacterium]|nr:AAA family ATPase [Micropepsaceae bacterium]
MLESFEVEFPNEAGQSVSYTLNVGAILFILGANGTGKSSLVSRIFQKHSKNAKRISAHRQTWFTSNSLDMTPRSRDDLERNIRSRDQQEQSRFRQDYASERTGLAIYDLIDADTMLERAIAALVRTDDIAGAKEKAKTPAPIQVINEMMRLSNIPIEISLEERQKVVARREGSAPYSVAELSDGERNAFLIAADVLTAAPGSLVIIDEPERHLHRSIISPLLSLLFAKRGDCAFVVSTHEVMLPVDNPGAQTLLVRSCKYEGPRPTGWKADFLAPNAPIDDELKRDILGARHRIIFVEGTEKSLDAPLYSLLFPQVSVIPKDNCRDVEHAIRGLREAEGMHWVKAWGIVDNDQRQADDIARLKALGVFALTHYSVESLYFHQRMIELVAQRKASMTGGNAQTLSGNAIQAAIAAAVENRAHMILKSAERLVRREIFDALPSRYDVRTKPEIIIRVDAYALRSAEEQRFDALATANDYDGLLQRYPLRDSAAFTRIVDSIGISRADYEAAVRTVLQDSADALVFLRGLFGSLPIEVSQA